MSRLSQLILNSVLALGLGLLALPQARAAISPEDLLPVDQAFALDARALGPERIEVRWKIAEGYYLYRHRTSVTATGLEGASLKLPDGSPHEDEFFGPVETYRQSLVGVLQGQASAGVATLQVKYQGCADAGICYPPQTRTLRVNLPAASAGLPTGLPLANPGTGANPLGALLGNQPALPENRAFSVEALADGGNRILVRLQPAPGYYIYRDRSQFRLEGDSGLELLAPRWPAGSRHRDEHFGEVEVYFQAAEVALPIRRQHPRPAKVTVTATFQGCQQDGICYPPLTRRLRLSLPEGQVATPALDATAVAAPAARPPEAEAAPATEGPAAPLALASELAVAEPSPDATAGNALRTPAPATPVAQAHSAARALAGALVLALLGGLVLNLMPCVLPILSLKALGLAQSGGSHAQARRHALWYTAGVLVAFTAVGALVVALRAAGQAAGWGFQLQQPWFVAALAYLMFIVGLSLSGVFTLGTGLGGGLANARSGPWGDFLTGVLACVVASPCIAPFMGPALAYAFAAPAAAGLLVFLVLGLGLALPFLLIGFVPALARRLPRPGAWMETLKQVMAFPMYLTAIWLLWILGRQRGGDAIIAVLAGVTVLALALWWFERSRWRGARVSAALAALLALAALVPAGVVGRLAPAASPAASEGVEAYSEQTLHLLRGENRVVFVNMTADWCVTCKANERNVLASQEFRDLLERTDAVYMRGDWTNADPAISAFLETHKAVGVPLYVVYGPGAPPAVLPPVLTQAIVTDALLRAAAR
jgi:thiol:disulfide interchange protein